MNRYLVSVTTPSYVPRAVGYVNSLPLVVSCRPVMVLLDFNGQTDPEGATERKLRTALDWVDFRKMPLPPTHSNYMVQHCFTDALAELADDDLVILSDMDITIQRDLSPEEWAYMEGATAGGRLCAWWNGTQADNLRLEAGRIGMTPEAVEEWGGDFLKGQHCYNCGVLVGRVRAFKRLKADYESWCDRFYAVAPHRSRCQFLINWCAMNGDYGFDLLPPTLHLHGHFIIPDTGEYILPAGSHFRCGVACWEGTPVVFRHAF